MLAQNCRHVLFAERADSWDGVWPHSWHKFAEFRKMISVLCLHPKSADPRRVVVVGCTGDSSTF